MNLIDVSTYENTCTDNKSGGSPFVARWRAYEYEELINRDKASLDIFWLRDESFEDSDNLPEPTFSTGKSS